MFRSMIVHVDDDPDASRRVAMAARMARALGSRLAGVYLVPIGELTPSVAALLPPAVVEARLTESGYAQDRAEALFRREVASLPADAVEFRAPAGSALAAAVAHARCADLAVIGQPGGDDGGFMRRLAEQVLLGSGAPLLFVPRATAVAAPGSNVLVAWDGGREAARAVRDALPLLAAAQRVTVFTAFESDNTEDALTQSQKRLGAWLAAHAIHAQFKRGGAGRDAAERLLSQVSDAGADLVVMGGYAHPRAREYVLGSATRTMLESMTVPVIMSH